jgi:hypothetical protein
MNSARKAPNRCHHNKPINLFSANNTVSSKLRDLLNSVEALIFTLTFRDFVKLHDRIIKTVFTILEGL